MAGGGGGTRKARDDWVIIGQRLVILSAACLFAFVCICLFAFEQSLVIVYCISMLMFSIYREFSSIMAGTRQLRSHIKKDLSSNGTDGTSAPKTAIKRSAEPDSLESKKPKKQSKESKELKEPKEPKEPKELKELKELKAPKTDPLTHTDTDRGIHYWLMKAEPSTRLVNGHDVKFSIDDLAEMSESDWDGVRNHEAKKNMMNMKPKDLCFFYHSNAKKSEPHLGPGIVGIMEVVNEQPIVDYTAFDKSHPYYDANSKTEDPRWFMSRVKFQRKLNRLIPLHELKYLVNEQKVKELQSLALVKRSRLSIVPISKDEWEYILSLEDQPVAGP